MIDKDRVYSANKGIKKDMTPLRIILMIAGGLVVGAISGLFGGGGGIIIVPLLSVVGGLREKEAHATSIAVALPIAIVTMSVYLITGTDIHIDILSYVVIGVLLGGLIGTILLRKLSSNVLRIIFYLIMIVAGVRMLI